MKTYSELLENKTDTVILSFGRMNPVSRGHEKLVDKVLDTARKYKADHYIYASKTQDKKKNPLDITSKLKYLNHSFPKANIVGADNKVRTFMEAAKFLNSKYDKLIMIAGSDRIKEFQTLLDKYNGKDYNYDEIKVISAGERDPDAEGVTGISGSKMREFVKNDDFESFKKGVPSRMTDSMAKSMFNDIKKGMNISENIIREQYMNNDIFLIGDIVEYNDEEYTISFRGPNYVLLDETKKVWLTDITPTDKINRDMINKYENKLEIANIIAESFGYETDKTDPVTIINTCIKKALDMELTESQLVSLDNMLIIANEANIPFDAKLAGEIGNNIDDLSEEELDELVDSLSEDDIINMCYEDDDFILIDEETGEVIEDFIDPQLNEVMSRAERIKAGRRMKRTKNKRARKMKISMKRKSDTKTLSKRARRAASKSLKQRYSRKPLKDLSTSEKERLEKKMKRKGKLVTRTATKMLPKVRRIEKNRLSSRSKK